MLDEPTTFKQLNDNLLLAAQACKDLMILRDDRRWGTVADLLMQLKSKAFELKLRSANEDIQGPR